jgi:hypothetical protein
MFQKPFSDRIFLKTSSAGLHLFALALSLAALLPPGEARGATVAAEYRAHAGVSVTISSARYVGSGADAFGALRGGTWGDMGDAGDYEAGAGRVSTSVEGLNVLWAADGSPPPRRIGISATATGHADAANPYSASGLGWYDLPLYSYSRAGCADGGCENIALTLDYRIDIATETSINDPLRGTAWADAEAFLAIDYSEDYSSDWGETEVEVHTDESVSGTYDITMTPGSIFALDLYILRVQGEANYTEVAAMPLPAGLPMLLASVLAFGALARRRRA